MWKQIEIQGSQGDSGLVNPNFTVWFHTRKLTVRYIYLIIINKANNFSLASLN